jgi:23S rRNA (cytidine1920-2'-O)/16S rRNA (cytidine1409-2'-O)-methyltransferase
VTRRRRERADLLLVKQGLAPSRSKAQALIMAGSVWMGQERVDKPGTLMASDSALEVRAAPRFVSRGGDKLDHGCERFAAHGLSVEGRVCADIGASTGGFTDCLLQRGAARVHAVDVGYGQLDAKLRTDGRVIVRERVNARHLERGDLGEPIELCVVDASFIGIGKLLPAIAAILAPEGELVALVKPQFEAGRTEVARSKGVIRDESVRQRALQRAREAIAAAGFDIVAEVDSPIRGPKGNLERLVYARRAAPGQRVGQPAPS